MWLKDSELGLNGIYVDFTDHKSCVVLKIHVFI